MAFLKLNGVEIPIEVNSGSESLDTAGASARSVAGGHYQDVRYTKRRWTFISSFLTEKEALAYGGLIRGEGQLFTMDDTTYSTKNVSPVATNAGGSYSSTVPTGFSGKSRLVGTGIYSDYPTEMIKTQQDLTFNVWTDTAATPSATEYLLNMYKTDYYRNSVRLYRTTSDNKLNYKISAVDASGSSDKTSHLSISDPFDGSFKMVTAVIRRNAESGEYNQYLYINGVLQAYATTSHTPDPSSWTNIKLGVYPLSSSLRWPDRIDDVQLLPYAAPTDMVLGWYNFGQEMGALPNLKMTGDITKENLVTVRGQVGNSEYIQTNGRIMQRLSFTLTEV